VKVDEQPEIFGPYRGAVAGDFDTPELRAALAELPGLIARGEMVQDGRNRLIRCRFRAGSRDLDLAVKAFGPPSGASRAWAGRRPSKARRSWDAARRLSAGGGLTPEPVAYLDQPGTREQGYYIACFSAGRTTFSHALNTIYRDHPDCEALMALLQTVADAIRGMHEAGLAHRDLGNQNILLRPEGDFTWTDPEFIDLNRAHLHPAVPLRDRARDLSRITLPSDFLRVFFQMVFGGPAPEPFLRWERHYRARFAWHTRTRAWRHPLRERNIPRGDTYPAPQDIWIWDERSGQAISAWTSRDRRRLYPYRAYKGVAIALARGYPAVHRAYRHHLRSAYRESVAMAGRIGVAVQARPETEACELELLQALGTPPVLVRFYHHETETDWSWTVAFVRRLHELGHRVTIALVQDRRAVLDPGRWRAFLLGVLDRVHDAVEAVEIGHAINRVKWGLWSPEEYRRLMEPAAEAMARYPGLDWLGPAGIDAEFPRIQALLHALPDGVRFSAVSQHLYVDRRGAPENRQGGMATLEKAAAARALAAASDRCGDRLIISEVNWPLSGTGIYSPVCSPYMHPGQTVGAPNVDEQSAADFMLRYLLITICSGLAERVFWWRLAAHGYGLADDRAPEGIRPRPAFHALAFFLRTTGSGRFLRCLSTPPGVHAWLFETGSRQQVWACAHPEPTLYHPPFTSAQRSDARGQALASHTGEIILTGSPVLFDDIRMEEGGTAP